MTAGADPHRQRTSLAVRAAAATVGLLAGAGVCDASAHVAASAASILDPAALFCVLSALVILAVCLVVLSLHSAARTVGDTRRLVAAWRSRGR